MLMASILQNVEASLNTSIGFKLRLHVIVKSSFVIFFTNTMLTVLEGCSPTLEYFLVKYVHISTMVKS